MSRSWRKVGDIYCWEVVGYGPHGPDLGATKMRSAMGEVFEFTTNLCAVFVCSSFLISTGSHQLPPVQEEAVKEATNWAVFFWRTYATLTYKS